MTTKLDELVPDVSEYRKKLALAEAEKAAQEARQKADTEAKRKALIDELSKTGRVSEEEGIRLGIAMIERAVSNGLTDVQVHRFPSQMCTDRGRAMRTICYSRSWRIVLIRRFGWVGRPARYAALLKPSPPSFAYSF